MLLGELRAEIAAVCTGLAAAGLVVGTAGNVSARAGELIAVTPSGLDYAALTAELVGVHRMDGTPVEAPLQPSSELPLHLAVYAAAAGAGVAAIVHTHAPAATALSALVDEVPAIHYQVASFGGPVAVAPYATYGTGELAANVVTALAGRSACLMANHGAVTTGPDLRTAVTRAQALEWVCDVYLRAAAAGRPRLLPPEEIETVVRKLSGYGQRPPA
jgi:L-fuculose-phosphate aldolase